MIYFEYHINAENDKFKSLDYNNFDKVELNSYGIYAYLNYPNENNIKIIQIWLDFSNLTINKMKGYFIHHEITEFINTLYKQHIRLKKLNYLN